MDRSIATLATETHLRIALIAVTIAACSGSSRRSGSQSRACEQATMLLTEAAELRADGYLGRALLPVRRAEAMCPKPETRWALAEALADVWLDERAARVYREISVAGSDGDRAKAAGPLAELAARPSHTRAASDGDLDQARLLHMAGVVLRVNDRDFERSLQRLDESYRLAPHPLTIVQMGMTHRESGDEISYRKFNARALAVAEETQGQSAVFARYSGHTFPVHAVAVSPDGRVLASGGTDNQLLLWDLTSGRNLGRLRWQFGGAVETVAFHPGGVILAAAGSQSGVLLWDTLTGEQVGRLAGDAGAIESVAFRPDGSALATAGTDGVVRVFEIATGTQLAELHGHRDRVSGVAFSPNGTTLVSGSWDNRILVWDIASATQLREIKGAGSRVFSLAISPDGDLVAAGDDDHTVKLYDTATGTLVTTLGGHTDSVHAVAFDEHGAQLVSGGNGGAVIIWDVAAHTALHMIQAHENWVYGVAFRPGSSQAVSGSWDNTIGIWDATSGSRVGVLEDRGSSIGDCELSPDGRQLGLATGGGLVLLDIVDGRMHPLVADDPVPRALAYRPDGNELTTVGADGQIRFWADPGGTPQMRVLDVSAGSARSIAYSPDSAWIAAGFLDQIGLWQLDRLDEMQALRAEAGAHVYSVAFSADGTVVAASGDGMAVTEWSVQTGAPLRTVRTARRGVVAIAYSPDGAQLAAGTADSVVRWSLDTGDEMPVSVHETELGGRILAIAFSADSALLASTRDYSIKLWSTVTGAEVHTLDGHENSIGGLAFTRDGARLISCSNDRTVKVWSPVTGELLATVFPTLDGEWVAYAPEGRIDGSQGALALGHWQVGTVRLPAFVGWQRNHQAGWMPAVMGQ